MRKESQSISELLPHSPDAEQDVIGSLLVEPKHVPDVKQILRGPRDFYDQRHAAIYRVIIAEYERDPRTDVNIITRALKETSWFADAGGVAYLAEMVQRVADPSNAPYYARTVREKATRRELVDIGDRMVAAARGNGDTNGLLRLYQQEVAAVQALAHPKPTFTFRAADDFDALELQRDYHVQNILAAGPVPTIFAGAFKTLKTSIVMDLCISLATGSRFLNYFQVNRPVRVAVMSGESGGFALQSMARRIAHSKGWPLASLGDSFRICTGVPSLGSPADMDELERFITETDTKAVVIDPAYLAMRGLRSDDAGNLFQMASFLDPLAAVGQRTGCTMILVHHTSRGATRANANEPAELADIAWGGFPEWAGQWILLARREKYDPDSNGEHRLWLTAGGRDGHSTLVGVDVTEGRQNDPDGRRWEVGVEDASTARRDAAEAARERQEQVKAHQNAKLEQKYREAIMAAMQRVNGDGDTKSAIRNLAGLNATRFDPAFTALIEEGVIESCEVTKNRQTHEGFRLARTRSDTLGHPVGQMACPGE